MTKKMKRNTNTIEKATTTESFMVTVFDIPLRDARALKQILGKSFSMYIADGSAISLITPEQFMEIRDIITNPSRHPIGNDEWDNRYLTAMKALHNMLKKITKDNRTTGTLKPIPVDANVRKHIVKKLKPVVVKEYKRKVRVNHLSPVAFSERVVRAELFAKWFKDNKTLLINDQKAAAFMFIHAIEKGELKW
jgi:hypothetical protein|tara:strand:- start:1406 stop:1984 length:579 start_codon:yes stop_codon:yes gene_type:complete